MSLSSLEAAKSSGALRSDSLPEVLYWLEGISLFAPFVEDHIRLLLVVDANIIQGELRWRLRRKKPEARSGLHEAAVSGVATLVAPTFLESEITEHLPRIAADCGVSLEAAESEWRSVRDLIWLHSPRASHLPKNIPVPDPKDVPYFLTCMEVGADAIYSRDKHLRQMKAPVISIAIDLSLRTYARQKLHFFVAGASGSMVGAVSLAALSAAAAAVSKAFMAFRRIDPRLQVAILAGIALLLTIPRVRARLAGAWRRLKEATSPLGSALAGIIEQMEYSPLELERAEAEIRAVVPARRKSPALARAKAQMLLAGKPLTLADLEKRMRAGGYSSRAKEPLKYLRRVLVASGGFTELEPGLWSLARCDAPSSSSD